MVKSVFAWDYGKFVPYLFHPSLTKHSSDNCEVSVPSFPVQCLLDMKRVVFVPVGFSWYPNSQEFYRFFTRRGCSNFHLIHYKGIFLLDVGVCMFPYYQGVFSILLPFTSHPASPSSSQTTTTNALILFWFLILTSF